MTDKALDFVIANSIEPYDMLPKLTDEDFDRYLANDGNSDGSGWPFRCWRMTFDYEKGDKGQWIPRNFKSDPAMSFLLLRKLAEEGDEPILEYENGWTVFGKTLGWTTTLQRHPEPGPAIEEYYARAHKIYVEEG